LRFAFLAAFFAGFFAAFFFAAFAMVSLLFLSQSVRIISNSSTMTNIFSDVDMY
jgi:hypothetical protein